MLHALRSKFKIRRSSTAILCISSGENKFGEKFSIGPSLGTKIWKEPSFGIWLVFELFSKESLVEEVDDGERRSSGELVLFFVIKFEGLDCLLNVSKPEIRLRNSSVVTASTHKGIVCRLGWDNSTSAVGGTQAKPSWSRRKASTSRRDDSPDLTPGRQVLLPNWAFIPLGLFGAKGSSSIGFQTATAVAEFSCPIFLRM